VGGEAGAAGGGSGGSPGGAGGAPSTPNLAFVTSVAFNPSQDGANADKHCSQLAAQVGLPSGTYVAWVSTSTVNARDKLGKARGWVRTDGLPFADTVDGLVAGQIFYPLRVDENGKGLAQNTRVATGTNPDGTAAALSCADWTDGSGSYFAGDAAAGTRDWTGRNQATCSEKARFYCFQVDNVAEVTPGPIPAAARRVFTSAKPFTPGGGLASADAQCAADAQAAGLAGSYLALLATDKSTAASRVTADSRAWYRPDGVKVAEPKALLGKGFDDLLAPPNVTADGATYHAGTAWTGDSNPSQTPPNQLTCADWTKIDGPTFQGNDGPTDSTWFGGALTSCADTENRLRCVEQ